MKFTADRDDAQITRIVKVEDGPTHEHDYSSTGKRYRVNYVSIKYTLLDGKWTVDYSYAITLGGPVLKQDGTDSKNLHRGHPQYNYRARAYEPEYQWLADLVDRLRPVDFPMLPEVDA